LFGRCAPFHDIELTTVLPIGFSCWTVGSTERNKPRRAHTRFGPGHFCSAFKWRQAVQATAAGAHQLTREPRTLRNIEPTLEPRSLAGDVDGLILVTERGAACSTGWLVCPR
jgi:hypothetical protein